MLERTTVLVDGLQEKDASKTELSIVIPVYNQERLIGSSLNRIRSSIEKISKSFEIVVVNDGSSDRTLQILEVERANDSRLKIISYTPNVGKGYAVKKGILESKGELVLFIDGDLDISEDSIKDYFAKLKDHDLVISSKYHPLSKVRAPLSRRFLSKAFSLLVRIAVGIKVKDTQSGLKAGNGRILREIFKVMTVERYAFDVELLAIATALKLEIAELPVQINLDRRFKVKEIAKMFVDVMRISFRFRIKHWYQKQLQGYMHR